MKGMQAQTELVKPSIVDHRMMLKRSWVGFCELVMSAMYRSRMQQTMVTLLKGQLGTL